MLSFDYWTTNFAEVQRALAAKNLSAARRTPLIAALPGTVSPTGSIEVLPILDAAGAGTTPRGGIATGTGGTAPVEGTGLAGSLAAAGLVLLAGAATVVGRRRRGGAR